MSDLQTELAAKWAHTEQATELVGHDTANDVTLELDVVEFRRMRLPVDDMVLHSDLSADEQAQYDNLVYAA